jgi:hypothetical protein
MQYMPESPVTLKIDGPYFRRTAVTTPDTTPNMLPLLCLSLLSVTEHGSPLGNDSLLLPLTGSLLVCTLGIHLLLQGTVTGLLSLRSVDLLTMSASNSNTWGSI